MSWLNALRRTARKAAQVGSRWRVCRIEQMESRELLAVAPLPTPTPPPINVGAVYYEAATGEDVGGDVFTITFNGGAGSTELTDLVIDTVKDPAKGFSPGDCFFHTAPGGIGAYESSPFTVVSQQGIDSVTASVVNGGTSLALHFSGFHAGDKLVFTIDVDEKDAVGSSTLAEGWEFQGSHFSASFAAPHYYGASSSDTFVDVFGSKMAGKSLDLPSDDYMPPAPESQSDRTAGAAFTVTQQALPITIAGNVYEDSNFDGVRQAGEPGLGSVQIDLQAWDGTDYYTVQTTYTGMDGSYSFTSGVLPGMYRLVEAEVPGYTFGGSEPGTVDGGIRGISDGPDILTDIVLVGGDDSVHNDFSEAKPASLSGTVYYDANNNGLIDPGELPIGGAEIQIDLKQSDGTWLTVYQTTSNDDGTWSAEGLPPGVYSVTETTPPDWVDGKDSVGDHGGTLVAPDTIANITLHCGDAGIHYNFGEILYASVSGYVYSDLNNDGVMDPNELGIGGVVVELLDANGQPTGRTTTTDDGGFYAFEELLPGSYGVRETQPAGWLDGLDTAGTVGGVAVGIAHNPGDQLDGIALTGGSNGIDYNFGEIAPASISGNVHAELDRDFGCVRDANEPWLSGVTIYLLDASGNRIATTTTDANGTYIFENLMPGTYGVEEVTPAGYLDGDEHVGSLGGALGANDVIEAIPVAAGDIGFDYNFCELVPASISGYVFQDGPVITYKEGDPVPDVRMLRDGILKAGDVRLSGIEVTLGDASGLPLLDASGHTYTVKTDANGYYEFKMLEPGVYTVLETQPTGYVDGIDTAGSVGGVALHGTAPLDPMVVESLKIDPKYDAIARISVGSGVNAQNYNFAEVLVQSVPDNPPPPPPYFPPPTTPPNLPFNPLVSAPVPLAHYAAMSVVTPPPPAMFGGSGGPGGNTWHLSVIDGGDPRRKEAGVEFAPVTNVSLYRPTAWNQADLGQSQWIVANLDGKVIKSYVFGAKKGIPLAADFNGDGVAEVAVFIDGQWYIDLNGDGVWDEGDLWARLGQATDQPVVGDWNGDGKADIGIFGPSWLGDAQAIAAEPGMPSKANRTEGRLKNVPPEPRDAAMGYRTMKKNPEGRMRSDLIDHVFQFGVEGDIPLVGDWNGDGIKTVGVFRDGAFFLDLDGDGRWSPGDVLAEFGQHGDLPIVGDWTGDGITKLGVYRNGKFILDTNNNRRIDADDKVFALGQPGDKPVAADFNGDGIDEVALYRDGAGTVERTASRR